MKNTKSNFALIMALGFSSLTSCDIEEVLTDSEIPAEIKSFITMHFPDHDILHAVKDKEGITKAYDIILEDNIQLEFNKNLEIISIDAMHKLPNEVVPENIRAYIAANFAGHTITEWEIEAGIQQIELENGIEIDFTLEGEFIKIKY
ncbi:PepSY-like domain-containing protein [Echinicola pacifica]|nr:PepSY-like domain-containing protein [Echinicola pacifica]